MLQLTFVTTVAYDSCQVTRQDNQSMQHWTQQFFLDVGAWLLVFLQPAVLRVAMAVAVHEVRDQNSLTITALSAKERTWCPKLQNEFTRRHLSFSYNIFLFKKKIVLGRLKHNEAHFSSMTDIVSYMDQHAVSYMDQQAL